MTGTEKVWNCIAQTSYKNLPIKSIAFSSDTSLLGVGFGNTLCLYAPETLKLKCALSAPSGKDGSVNKITVSLPTHRNKSDLDKKRLKFLEKRKKILEAIQSILDTDQINTIAKSLDGELKPSECGNFERKNIKQSNLTVTQQKMIFNQILASNEINLFQKINIYGKLRLRGRVPIKWKQMYADYCSKIDEKQQNAHILERILNLSSKQKFKFALKYKFHKRHIHQFSDTLPTMKRIINFTQSSESASALNGVSNSRTDESFEESPDTQQPQRLTVQINHLAFCTGELAHLAIVCTENRLLIWNLLTLRLQSSFKIAVDKISIDSYTNLVAIITTNQDLYVFLPNTPIPLYQHKKLPKIEGLAWIPRHYPRTHSLTIDWQAITELYFLTENQVKKSTKNLFCCFEMNCNFLCILICDSIPGIV